MILVPQLLILLLVFSEYALEINSWHAYQKGFADNKFNFTISTESFLKLKIKYKLWSNDLIDGNNRRPINLLYGFQEGIEAIWRNQNPQNCSDASFIISPALHLSGFGSEIHVEGAILGLALQLNRVLLDFPFAIHPKMKWRYDNSFCYQQNKRNKECYFLPWSKCSINDAINNRDILLIQDVYHGKKVNDSSIGLIRLNAKEISDFAEGKGLPDWLMMMASQKSIMKLLVPYYPPGYFHGFLPDSLRPLLQSSPMNPSYYYYWWRAVATAYFIRPNEATLKWSQIHHRNISSSSSSRTELDSPCIAVYVRRGDKAKEMQLVPLQQYLAVTESLWNPRYLPALSLTTTTSVEDSKSNRYKQRGGVVFFNSEDPSVLKEAIQWSQDNQWELFYTNVYDRSTATAATSSKSVHNNGRHVEEEYLSMILNLEYAISCDAWVCTLASNYCRVIDELRVTIGGKGHGIYADLSSETCRNPPCISDGNGGGGSGSGGGEDIISFDW